MTYYNITQLRTKHKQLVKDLKAGKGAILLSRSEIVGEITSRKDRKVNLPGDDFDQHLKEHARPKTINPDERKTIYKKRLLEKYGENISR